MERPPLESGRLVVFVPDSVGLAHLVQHRSVRQLERRVHLGVRFEQRDAAAHASHGVVHALQQAGRGGLLGFIQAVQGLVRYPIGVPLDESLEKRYDSLAPGRRQQVESQRAILGILKGRGDQGHLGGGQVFRPDPGGTVSGLPIHSTPVAHRVDLAVAILQLEFLLLFGKQTRVYPGIFGQRSSRDLALEPDLEKGLLG